MKKTLILLSALFLTGCTINYEIDYSDSLLKETISGSVLREELTEIDYTEDNPPSPNLFKTYLDQDQHALINGDSLYTKKINDNGNELEYNFTYTYNNNYNYSRIINTCFSGHLVIDNDDYLYIKLFGNFDCLYSKKININVKTDMAVLEHNANKVKKNTYGWTIKEEDISDTDIYIRLSKKVMATQGKENLFATYKIVALVIILLLIGGFYVFARKNKNKI